MRTKRPHSELLSALISRHDAQSRRTAAKVNEILTATVPLECVRGLAQKMVAQFRAAFDDLPARYVARRPGLVEPDAVADLLRGEVAAILAELASGLGVAADEVAPRPGLDISSPRARPAADEPPPVRRSPSLPAARAQGARLSAYLIDLRGRLVPYAPISLAGSPGPRDGNTNGHHPSPTAMVGKENAS